MGVTLGDTEYDEEGRLPGESGGAEAATAGDRNKIETKARPSSPSPAGSFVLCDEFII